MKSKKSERLIFKPAHSFSKVGIVGQVFRRKQLLRDEYGMPDAFASLYIDHLFNFKNSRIRPKTSFSTIDMPHFRHLEMSISQLGIIR